MALLRVAIADEPLESYELTRPETIVGRHPNCHLVLPETTVSRQHFRILKEPDGYFLEDMKSHNGTLLNGKRIEKRSQLQTRDEIRIKDIAVTFFDTDGNTEETMNLSGTHVLDDSSLFQVDSDSRPSTIVTTLDLQKDQRTESNAAVKLRAILEITQNIGKSLDMRQVLPKTLDSVFRIFPQADRGFILLEEGTGKSKELKPCAIRTTDQKGGSPGRCISSTIASKVMNERQAILSADAIADDRFQTSDSVADFGIRSVMCAPLMSAAKQPVGIIQVDTSNLEKRFSEEDLDVLASVAMLAGQTIEHARMLETHLAMDRAQHDLMTAQQVQLHLLPRRRPDLSAYRFYDYYQAAQTIGGDYFGYINLPDGRVAIALGDVAGKGISAALLVARLCAEVRYGLVTAPTPADAVRRINRELTLSVLNGRFVTFAMCILDPTTNEFTLLNAGHMPPMLRSGKDGKVSQIGSKISGPPLGIEAEWDYQQQNYRMEVGDAILLYTDGVSEAMNEKNELYGTKRIARILRDSANVTEVGKNLLEDVGSYSNGVQKDDLCLLCFSRAEDSALETMMQ